ncbi:MAG: orotidine 5'-phosphate decarboxylase / HUMPS family protein [Nitrososphaerales archaeon]
MDNKIRDFGIIFANDLPQSERALKLSEEIAPYIDGIKFGVVSILDKGVSLITKVKERINKPIIADFKIADIGFWNRNKKTWEGTNSKIVEKLAEAGADYIVCHAVEGPLSLQECIEVAHLKGAKILVLPFMTSIGAELFFAHPIDKDYVNHIIEELGIKIQKERLRECKIIFDLILILAEFFGADGYVCPANNPMILRRARYFTDKPIFGPGIGRQAKGDVTFAEQIKTFYEICGRSSAIIIGSSIYAAANPIESAKGFARLRDEVILNLRIL